MSKIRKVYVCGVDWQHELGEALGGTDCYPSIKNLKEEKSCWESCGIVEISLNNSNATWVESQDFSKGDTVSSKEMDTPEYKKKRIKHVESLIEKAERNVQRLKNFKTRLEKEDGL